MHINKKLQAFVDYQKYSYICIAFMTLSIFGYIVYNEQKAMSYRIWIMVELPYINCKSVSAFGGEIQKSAFKEVYLKDLNIFVAKVHSTFNILLAQSLK